ncbi:MAG: glycerol-3-phosphate 1-O-acyltransferase PlsY [Peptococcaceae bacterium]|nr:glycerol-3-phosphate 1-O-acyltransferase PlsY [Peptococcaceae bacterium]
MNYFLIILMLLLAALLGSIPSAYLIGKCQGIDIRQYGSGNMGATNTMRVLGRRWGFLVLGIDVVKGFAAAWLVFTVLGDWGAVVGGIIAFVTHDWNPWFKFRPVGKGVACALGTALFVIPIPMGIGLIAFVATVVLTRYVSLASIFAGLSALGMTFVFPTPLAYKIFIGVAVGFVLLRHKENMKRLFAGTETRIEWGKKEVNKKNKHI